ncbi:MAG TPA: DUF3800 domain-containing protein [Elusimicrobia bacterium]|nr:DUF3800 domain-containing protein [Elusimicrobiota bacterium]
MPDTFNIYCDESCHLENDGKKYMVMGAIWCPTAKAQDMFKKIREIKQAHALAPDFEIKWVRVDGFTLKCCSALVDYFFGENDLHFRAIIADKKNLNHAGFNQTHDDWYYKMYFRLLNVIFEEGSKYRIYLDVKDSRSGAKIQKLHEVLTNANYDFNRKMVERVQAVKSDDVALFQLVDILIGALQYSKHYPLGSNAKSQLIMHIRQKSGLDFTRNTLPRVAKFNLFHWQGSVL